MRGTHWPNRTAADRFWSHVDKSGECWVWTGALRNGYGHFAVKHGQQRYAHRLAWEWTHGPIPAGTFVCHHCDRKACVRPDHLFLGTPLDNATDMIQKGRPHGRPNGSPNRVTPRPRAPLTECKRGHPFPESQGSRGSCLRCRALLRRTAPPEVQAERRRKGVLYMREYSSRKRAALT